MKPGIPWPKEKRERDVRVGSYRVGQAEVWEISTWERSGGSCGQLCEPGAHSPSHAPRPSEEMVKMVLSRPCHPDDQFTTSILRHWCMKHDELLAEHIKSLLIKNNSLPRKRQRWEWALQDTPGRAAAVHPPSRGSPCCPCLACG